MKRYYKNNEILWKFTVIIIKIYSSEYRYVPFLIHTERTRLQVRKSVRMLSTSSLSAMRDIRKSVFGCGRTEKTNLMVI